MAQLSPYDEACIRAKKRIEHNYAMEAGMEPPEKQAWESEREFRTRVRETLMDAPLTLRAKMREDKRREFLMLRKEHVKEDPLS